MYLPQLGCALRCGRGPASRKRIFHPCARADIDSGARAPAARAAATAAKADGGEGGEGGEKGPGIPSDRSRPVGNGLALRCLLGARAPPGSNPPPSRGLRSSPLPRCAWRKRDLRDPSSGTTRSGRLTAPAGWPGAGLPSNIPLIAAMSTSPVTLPAATPPACSALYRGDTIEPPFSERWQSYLLCRVHLPAGGRA
jgi:hypothetical protein